MRSFLFFLFFIFSFGAVQAQSSFTEHLRSGKAGKGKVVIEQSQEIENVINHKVIKESSTHNTSTPKQDVASPDTTQAREAHEYLLDKFRNSYTKDHQPAKMQGYRIQVYAGPKNIGQNEARKIEQACKKALPGISTYVRFIQPRWTCRVGDFQTREDAILFYNKLQEAKVSPQITIVKCEIFKVY